MLKKLMKFYSCFVKTLANFSRCQIKTLGERFTVQYSAFPVRPVVFN